MKIIGLLILTISFAAVNAQSVVIAETESTPDAAAILDVQSTSKGMLIPRMTEAQRGLIASPPTGLLVFQIDANTGFYFYDGSSWIPLLDDTEQDPVFGDHPASMISNPGSGSVITTDERSTLGKAILSDGGFPSMTYAERDAMTAIFEGMVIYQIDNTPGLRVYNGSNWDLMHPKTAYLKDVKSEGANGGTPAAGIWNRRDINTLEGDEDFVSLDDINSQFTLEPGEYNFEGYVNGTNNIDQFKARLYNASSDLNVILGSTELSNNNNSNDEGSAKSLVFGRLSVTSSTTYEIQFRSHSVATNGYGLGTSFGNELYLILKITKTAD